MEIDPSYFAITFIQWFSFLRLFGKRFIPFFSLFFSLYVSPLFSTLSAAGYLLSPPDFIVSWCDSSSARLDILARIFGRLGFF